jgi:hypothetical protein
MGVLLVNILSHIHGKHTCLHQLISTSRYIDACIHIVSHDSMVNRCCVCSSRICSVVCVTVMRLWHCGMCIYGSPTLTSVCLSAYLTNTLRLECMHFLSMLSVDTFVSSCACDCPRFIGHNANCLLRTVFFIAIVMLINARDFLFSFADESADALAKTIAAMPRVRARTLK